MPVKANIMNAIITVMIDLLIFLLLSPAKIYPSVNPAILLILHTLSRMPLAFRENIVEGKVIDNSLKEEKY
jgi:hypothetical protein